MKKTSSLILFFISIIICILLTNFSEALTITSIHGSAGIEGYRKGEDTTTIEISEAATSIVKVDDTTLCSCTENAGTFNCICQITDNYTEGSQKYYGITVLNADGTTNDGTIASIYIDTLGGEITFSLSKSAGNITISSTITDKASEDLSGCSGIKRVEVYVNNALFPTPDINGATDDCTKTQTTIITPSTSGLQSIKLKAYDNVGNSYDSEEQNITVDLAAPTAQNLKFFFYGTQTPIEKISNKPINVDVYFEVLEENLESITADLSNINFNPMYSIPYQNIDALSSCTKNESESKYICLIRGKVLQKSTEQINVTIAMRDADGNENSSVLTKTFGIDSADVNVLFIGTDKCINNGNCFVKNGLNTLKMSMNAPGKTFEDEMVYFSLDGQKVKVTNCSNTECQSTISYNCNDGASHSLIITADSQDDLGNDLVGNKSTDVICDNTPPSVNNVTFSSTNQYGVIEYGDVLTITANVSEGLGNVKASVNLSELMDGQVKQTDCSRVDNNFICRWEVQVLKSGFISPELSFEFYDTAGNQLSYKAKIEVLKTSNETKPNNWDVILVERMPQELRAASVSKTNANVKTYYHIKLSPKYSDVSTLAIDTVCDTSNVTFIMKPSLMNIQKGSKDPFIVMDILNKNIKPGTYQFKCVLKIVTRQGNIIYKNPEEENLMLEVVMLQSEDQVNKIKDEIINVKEGWLFSEGFTDMLKAYSMFSKLCVIGQLFSVGATAVGQGEQAAAPGVDTLVASVPPAESVRKTVETTSGTVGQTAERFNKISGSPACKFITCDEDWSKKSKQVISNYCDAMGGNTEAFKILSANRPCESFMTSDKSIVIAAGTLCIRDMLYHLGRYRAIEANYLHCLISDYKAGIPLSSCSQTRSYMKCKFFIGEAVNMFPWTNMIQEMTKVYFNILKDPFAMLGVISTVPCWSFVAPGMPATAHSYCMVVAEVSQTTEMIKGVLKEYKSLYDSTKVDEYVSGVLAEADQEVKDWENVEQG